MLNREIPIGFGKAIYFTDSGVEETDLSYLAFVEEVRKIDPEAPVESPLGTPLTPLPHWWKEGAVTCRLSGFETRAFSERALEVTRFANLNLDEPARARRRADLLRFFEDLAVPAIDLYGSRKRRDVASLGRRLMPGRWVRLFMSSGGAAGADVAVYMGEPDPDSPQVEFAPGRLTAIFDLPAAVESDLRDIFSLKHIPDNDDTGRAEPSGATNPPPSDGPRPDVSGNPVRDTKLVERNKTRQIYEADEEAKKGRQDDQNADDDRAMGMEP